MSEMNIMHWTKAMLVLLPWGLISVVLGAYYGISDPINLSIAVVIVYFAVKVGIIIGRWLHGVDKMNYRRSKHWMVHIPGQVYGNDLRFERSLNEIEVRQYLREYYGVKRLWSGLEVWIP